VFGKGAAWLATLPPRFAFWAARQVISTTALSVKTFLALLGEEARRWTAVAVWAALVFWAYFWLGPLWAGLRQVCAFAVLCWFWGAAVAAKHTLHNRMQAVRGREFFKRLDKKTDELGEKITGAVRDARSPGGTGKWALHRPVPQPERVELTADDVAGMAVQFEPVFRWPGRRRRA
jgi:hypothetical protein